MGDAADVTDAQKDRNKFNDVRDDAEVKDTQNDPNIVTDKLEVKGSDVGEENSVLLTYVQGSIITNEERNSCWPIPTVFNPCYWCYCDRISQRAWCRILGIVEMVIWTPVWVIYCLRSAQEPFVPQRFINRIFFGLSTAGIILSMISGVIILVATFLRSKSLLILHLGLEVLLADVALVLLIFGGIIYFGQPLYQRMFALVCVVFIVPSMFFYVYSALVTYGHLTELRAGLPQFQSSNRVHPSSSLPSVTYDELGSLEQPAAVHPLGHRYEMPYYAPFFPSFMMYDYHPFLHDRVHLGIGFHHHHWDYW